MSYEQPDDIPASQVQNALIWNSTMEVVRTLDMELRALGLRMMLYKYFKNEYCGERVEQCGCPHWFQIRVESLFKRVYEPRCYIFVCKRKRVYELRYEGKVDDDFWIENAGNRTQECGKYIHSYSLQQAAEDIRKIHQATEVHDYKGEKFAKYYAVLFRQEEDPK